MRTVLRRPTLRRLALLSLTIGVAVATTHCGSEGPDSNAFPLSRADRLAARLHDDTGFHWLVQGDRATDDVQVLVPIGAYAKRGETPEATVRDFVKAYAGDLGAANVDAELGQGETHDEPGGTSTVRFTARHPKSKRPVFDRELVGVVNPKGGLSYLLSPLRADIAALDGDPSLSESAAREVARKDIAAACPEAPPGTTETRIELGIDADAVPARLAYRAHFDVMVTDCVAPVVWIDATSGAVIKRVDSVRALMSKDNTGARGFALFEKDDRKTLSVKQLQKDLYVLDSEDGPVNVRTFTPQGQLVSSPFPNAFDVFGPGAGAAVDAHYGVYKAAEYFAWVHGWSGFDGKGTSIPVVVHENNRSRGNAAFLAGTATRSPAILVGDGVPVCGRSTETIPTKGCVPMGAGLDIMGHEFTHGIIAATSKLAAGRESGAVDEAIADVLGTSFEHALAPDPDLGNLVIGERATLNNLGLRAMDSPVHTQLPIVPCPAGQQPHPGNDDCFVHTNLGIGDQAWFLMTLGGTHRKTKVQVKQGIGWTESASMWFYTGTRLAPQSGFVQLASAQVAYGLYRWGFGSPQVAAIACAWSSVGALATPEALLGVTCSLNTAPSKGESSMSSSCRGVEEGTVCAGSPANVAYVCRRGQIAGSVSCKDSTQSCVSGAGSKATVAPDGALACR